MILLAGAYMHKQFITTIEGTQIRKIINLVLVLYVQYNQNHFFQFVFKSGVLVKVPEQGVPQRILNS